MYESSNVDRGIDNPDGGILPLDKDNIFADHKGRYKKSTEKRQTKLLKKVPPLSGFLDEGEYIAFVTTGCTPTSILEQLFTGWIFVYLKRCLLVFTNKRIIHLPAKPDYSYKNSIAEIRFADCRQIKLRGSRLRVHYKSNKKEDFLFIARKERKKIKALLGDLPFDTDTAADAGRRHLCPRCANPLEKALYECRHCRLAFKSRAQARKLAVWLPGGGYFYARHPFLGAGDAVVEVALTALVVVSIFDYLSGREGAAAAIVTFSIVLAIEKMVSVFHSNHFISEYITEEKSPIYYSSTAAG